MNGADCVQVKSAQERRKLVLPFLQWAFGLLWAILLELVRLQRAEDSRAAATILAARPLLRVLHDASCAQLLERLLRAFVTCRVWPSWPHSCPRCRPLPLFRTCRDLDPRSPCLS